MVFLFVIQIVKNLLLEEDRARKEKTEIAYYTNIISVVVSS